MHAIIPRAKADEMLATPDPPRAALRAIGARFTRLLVKDGAERNFPRENDMLTNPLTGKKRRRSADLDSRLSSP